MRISSPRAVTDLISTEKPMPGTAPCARPYPVMLAREFPMHLPIHRLLRGVSGVLGLLRLEVFLRLLGGVLGHRLAVFQHVLPVLGIGRGEGESVIGVGPLSD